MSGRVKASRLNAVPHPLDEEREVADPRRQEAQSLQLADGDAVQAVEDVFAGWSLLQDRQKMTMLVTTASEVRDQWARVRESFLVIGRKLLALEENLSPDEFEILRREHGRIFPFSATVGSQLRQVARAVRAGRIPLEQCPHGYSVAYLLATMSDEELARAREANLVRPDVTRSTVVAFRKALALEAQANSPIAAHRIPLTKLQAELEQMAADRRRMLEKLREMGQRRREILEKLHKIGLDA